MLGGLRGAGGSVWGGLRKERGRGRVGEVRVGVGAEGRERREDARPAAGNEGCRGGAAGREDPSSGPWGAGSRSPVGLRVVAGHRAGAAVRRERSAARGGPGREEGTLRPAACGRPAVPCLRLWGGGGGQEGARGERVKEGKRERELPATSRALAAGSAAWALRGNAKCQRPACRDLPRQEMLAELLIKDNRKKKKGNGKTRKKKKPKTSPHLQKHSRKAVMKTEDETRCCTSRSAPGAPGLPCVQGAPRSRLSAAVGARCTDAALCVAPPGPAVTTPADLQAARALPAALLALAQGTPSSPSRPCHVSNPNRHLRTPAFPSSTGDKTWVLAGSGLLSASPLRHSWQNAEPPVCPVHGAEEKISVSIGISIKL